MAILKSLSPDEFLKANGLPGFDNQLTESPASGSPTFTAELMPSLTQPTEDYVVVPKPED